MTDGRDGGREDGRRGVARLLRWYPDAWRRRYGDEFAAFVEDELDGARPTVRLRVSLARAGLAERARDGGLVGESRPASDRVRAGALVVLAAWGAAVVAGAGFAKTSEHFAGAAPTGTLATARGAFAAVVVLGTMGAASMVAGVVAALPAAVTHLWSGGWASVRGLLVRAVVVTGITAAAMAPLAAWAHHLDAAQRNGADGAYTGAFATWAVLAVVSLTLWTAAGIGWARRLELGPRVLRFEAALAVVVAAVTASLAVAVAVWWGAMARVAPSYLVGTAPGTHPSPWPRTLVTVESLLVAASVVAGWGVVRLARSWRSISTP